MVPKSAQEMVRKSNPGLGLERASARSALGLVWELVHELPAAAATGGTSWSP